MDRVTEPVRLLEGATRLPEMFSVPRLALASTAHVSPEIVSGQAVTGVAERVVPGILGRLFDAERRVARMTAAVVAPARAPHASASP